MTRYAMRGDVDDDVDDGGAMQGAHAESRDGLLTP